MTSFADRLSNACRKLASPVVVGIDPRFEQLPEPLTHGVDPKNRAAVAAAYAKFGCEIIDVVAPLVPAVKPQMAFYEQLGLEGMQALKTIVDRARSAGMLVILDGKRNDIGTTAEAYADGLLGAESPWGGDALTVSPYLGNDSLEPFVKTAVARDAGLFVLVKTSNPGSGQFQDRVFTSDDVTGKTTTLYRLGGGRSRKNVGGECDGERLRSRGSSGRSDVSAANDGTPRRNAAYYFLSARIR